MRGAMDRAHSATTAKSVSYQSPRHSNMNEQEKQELSKSIEKRYGKRKRFKFLEKKAHRDIYKEDILQPMQKEFRDVYKSAHVAKQHADKAIDKCNEKREQELEEAYKQNSKNVLTLEQVTLTEIHHEHPTMMSKEDIIKWPTKSTQTQ